MPGSFGASGQITVLSRQNPVRERRDTGTLRSRLVGLGVAPGSSRALLASGRLRGDQTVWRWCR